MSAKERKEKLLNKDSDTEARELATSWVQAMSEGLNLNPGHYMPPLSTEPGAAPENYWAQTKNSKETRLNEAVIEINSFIHSLAQ